MKIYQLKSLSLKLKKWVIIFTPPKLKNKLKNSIFYCYLNLLAAAETVHMCLQKDVPFVPLPPSPIWGASVRAKGEA
jgi:hypothetical protein